MKFTKELTATGMKLTGKEVCLGKFTGLGYTLEIGGAKVDLCGIGRDMLGVDLAVGESVGITKIVIEFER